MLEVEEPDLFEYQAVPVHDDLTVELASLPGQVGDPMAYRRFLFHLGGDALLACSRIERAHLR